MVAPVPIPQAEALPECHTRGQEPQGYDPDDGVCWNCRDKFTCLPDAVDHGLVDEGVHVDREVEAVLAGNMTLRMAVERMRTRLTIMNRGADIPLDLQVSSPIETKTHTKPPPPPEPVAEPEPVRVSQEAAASAIAVPAKKKTVKKKPTRRAPAPDVSKLVDAQGRPTLKNGKPLPPIRPNTKKQMATALARVKIGQPCDLEVGMQLVRKTKDGEHVAVKIKPLGFELDGVLYSSLSTAIMYRLRKMQSGNAYFHLQNNQCTELWDADGHVLAGYST